MLASWFWITKGKTKNWINVAFIERLVCLYTYL